MSTLIGQRIGVTISLVLLTAAIIVVVGVGLGDRRRARPRHGRHRRAVRASTVSAALPAFAAALLLQFVFGVMLGWFPVLIGTGDGFVD